MEEEMELSGRISNREDVAFRIRSLRNDMGFSPEEMAKATGRTVGEYLRRESGESDFTFQFIYQCAEKLGVDFVDLLTGESPSLKHYDIVRNNTGLVLERDSAFHYLHKAPHFANRLAEPFLVEVPYEENLQHEDIHMSRHEGQEFDYVLKGHLRFRFEGRFGDTFEEVGPGDSIFYNSGKGHGMIAIGNEDAQILAIVIKPCDEDE